MCAVLRSVDEKMMTRSSGGNRFDSVQGFTLYESRQAFEGPFPDTGDVPLEFALHPAFPAPSSSASRRATGS